MVSSRPFFFGARGRLLDISKEDKMKNFLKLFRDKEGSRGKTFARILDWSIIFTYFLHETNF